MRTAENKTVTNIFEALAKELYSSYCRKVKTRPIIRVFGYNHELGYWCIVSHSGPNTFIRIKFETEQVIVLIRQYTLVGANRDVRFYQYESPTLMEDLLCELLMIPVRQVYSKI